MAADFRGFPLPCQASNGTVLRLILFILTVNGFLPGGCGTTIRHNTQATHITQISHHAQTKHSTQNYTNNKEQTTHNEYNGNTITTTIIYINKHTIHQTVTVMKYVMS
jgi:hypothetical protein